MVLMCEHLHSSGAISIGEQVGGAAVNHWEGLSEASSIVIEGGRWRAVEERVLGWFGERGVHCADPQQALESLEDRYHRSLSLRSSSHINYKPTLSRRRKILSQLHINLEPLEPPPHRLTDSC